MSSSVTAGHTPARPGIPRKSGIPTPGRPRSSSSAGTGPDPKAEYDSSAMSKALADAIKANDPSQHRVNGDYEALGVSTRRPSGIATSTTSRPSHASSIARPPSSASSHGSLSLRMPTSGYDSSAPRTPLSASSARGTPFRTKTPTAAPNHAAFPPPPLPLPKNGASSFNHRPASRQSDVRSSSRLGFGSVMFSIGDHVRIESLGVDGILRFLGETEFKPGVWAGVELIGMHGGKGKNDGSVAGIPYFHCPPNCGVFVASAKLSLIPARPASVASITSSRSGRATPSLPQNRPSTSQSVRTPAPIMKRTLTSVENHISTGSRASKYVGVTAKQLSARAGAASPSPTPLTTPKAPRTSSASVPTPKARQSLGTNLTPKASRIQSSRSPIPDVPQLPSSPSRNTMFIDGRRSKPLTPTFSQTSTETYVDSEAPEPGGRSDELRLLESNNKALQDKIARLISGAGSSPPSSTKASPPRPSYPVDDPRDAQIIELQERIQTLEAKSHQAKLETEREHGRALEAVSSRLEALEEEKKSASAQVTELQSQLRTLERSLKERQDRIEAMERTAQSTADQAEKAKAEVDAKLRDALAKVADSEALVASLKEAIDAKASVESENDALLQAKNTEISLLTAQVTRITADLEEERRELGTQINELRQAGQETIALYEERLSASETLRYELEDTIHLLQEQVKNQDVPPNPAEIARVATTAAEIDNEMLKEQIVHLTTKLATLQDQLEDAQAMQERDEEAIKARILKYKETENLLKKEVLDSRKEVEKAIKSGDGARVRVEELMEALRENGIALENARGEVEGLRAEVANLEGLRGEAVGFDEPPRTAGDEKAKLLSEIARLKDQLSASSTDRLEAETITGLRLKLEAYELQKAELERACEESNKELRTERQVIVELRRTLEERMDEIDSIRKAGGRENTTPSTPNGKEDGASLRNQITGMKHIIEELTKENGTLSSRNKMLESDNKVLTQEAEELHQTIQGLESTMEENILKEERELAKSSDVNGPTDPEDPASLQRALQENKVELEQLRKQLPDMEKKHARVVHDLNKEISELENLVEAKIYREDDLERELEKCKQKLAQAQRSSHRTSGESLLSNKARPSSTYSITTQPTMEDMDDDNICEVCGEKGHDILSCKLVFSDTKSSTKTPTSASSEMWCDDCESRSHSTLDCPHSQDVF